MPAGPIITALGFPPNSNQREVDAYARAVERFAWENLIPQSDEVTHHYYCNLLTETTVTGSGTIESPYTAFRSIKDTIENHDPEDILELHVRTSPTLTWLRVGSTHKVLLDSNSPEVRWVPWGGQARFSSAVTNYTTGWTLDSGTIYRRTVAKPGWVASTFQGFMRPSQMRYVASTAALSELYTWHHDGTQLWVNIGANPNGYPFYISTCPRVKDNLIQTDLGCRRILLSGIYTEGYGVDHGEAGADTNASGVSMRHGNLGDHVVLSSVTDMFGGGHQLSWTANALGAGAAVTTYIDCVTGGGYEVTKGGSPFNNYCGADAEVALLRCRVVAGPAQAEGLSRCCGGHGSNIGLFFVHDFVNHADLKSRRPTIYSGGPYLSDGDLQATPAFRRAVVSRFNHQDPTGLGSYGAFIAYDNHAWIGCQSEGSHILSNNNFLGSPALQAGTGLMINSALRWFVTQNATRMLGIGGSPSKTFINCLFALDHSIETSTVNWGQAMASGAGMRYHNCVFANIGRANFNFDQINISGVFNNCGFYRCTPPSNGAGNIILDNYEPYMASFESQLLGLGVDVSSLFEIPWDGNRRPIVLSSPPLGPFSNNAEFEWAGEEQVATIAAALAGTIPYLVPDSVYALSVDLGGTVTGTPTYALYVDEVLVAGPTNGTNVSGSRWNFAVATPEAAEVGKSARIHVVATVNNEATARDYLSIVVESVDVGDIGGGGGGSGDFTVTVTATVGGNGVRGVLVSLVGTSTAAYTNTLGVAVLNADADTYTLRVTPPNGYLSVADQPLEIDDADVSVPVALSSTNSPEPGPAGTCLVTVKVIDEMGFPFPGVEVTAKLDGAASQIASQSLVAYARRKKHTNANGICYISLIRPDEFSIGTGYYNLSFKTREGTITLRYQAPNEATATLEVTA